MRKLLTAILECDTRAAEGMIGLLLLVWGGYLAFFPLSAPHDPNVYRVFNSMWLHKGWGGVMVALGLVQTCATLTNRLRLRRVCAVLCVGLWVMFAGFYARTVGITSGTVVMPVFALWAFLSTLHTHLIGRTAEDDSF